MTVATILAAGTTAVDSATFVVSGGTPVTVGLFVAAGEVPPNAQIDLYEKTPGADKRVQRLDPHQQTVISGGGTFFVRRLYAPSAVGVFQDS